MDLVEFNRLKERIDKLKEQEDRAAGVMDSLVKQLKGLGYTEEEASKAIIGLEKQEQRLKREYDEALLAFKDKWKGKID
jgi:Holliday junction resolvasome RuvABC DNA-binding subunit